MFCKNCGNKIEDNTKFCPNCGYNADASAVSAPVQSKGFNETTVIEVSKDNEQKTIQRYQSFGWTLQNNQEVNVTSVTGGGSSYHGTGSSYVRSTTNTYVKLTFERNTGINNFDKLDERYKQYKNIQDEYRKLELALQVKDFSTKTAVWTVVISCAIGLFYGLLSMGSFFGFMFVFYMVLLFAMLGALVGAITGSIAGKRKKSALKKKLLPQMAEMDEKMDTLANEARQYLR